MNWRFGTQSTHWVFEKLIPAYLSVPVILAITNEIIGLAI